MSPRILAVLLATSSAAFAGGSEFDRVVKAIESHYGTRQQHIPFLGLADLAIHITRPEGATGFKLAVFEDLKSPPGETEWRERDRFMDTIGGPKLRPLVRTHSRHDGEATYIFMDPASKSARILIATFERDQATVIEVQANVDKLLASLEDPEHAGHTLGEE
ncbi:MAG TPA: hypothetical protein VMT86_09840 [Bryobacteraceae bacterium]|nr:hypothetical protein [Bryobacteraceae bacterium]